MKNQTKSTESEELYDLQTLTMDILRFLSSLTTLYAAPSQDAPQEKDTVEVLAFPFLFLNFAIISLNLLH